MAAELAVRRRGKSKRATSGEQNVSVTEGGRSTSAPSNDEESDSAQPRVIPRPDRNSLGLAAAPAYDERAPRRFAARSVAPTRRALRPPPPAIRLLKVGAPVRSCGPRSPADQFLAGAKATRIRRSRRLSLQSPALRIRVPSQTTGLCWAGCGHSPSPSPAPAF